MSSFGSSAINKSTKKLAPKAPARRRPGAGPDGATTSQAASQASARSSVDRQTPSATLQPSAKPVEPPQAPTASEAHVQEDSRAEVSAQNEQAQTAAPPGVEVDARQAIGATVPAFPHTTAVATQQPIADTGTEPRTDSGSTIGNEQAAAALVGESGAQGGHKAVTQTPHDDVEDTVERSPKRRRIEQPQTTRRTPSPAATTSNTTILAPPTTPPPTQPTATSPQPHDPKQTTQAAAVEQAESESQEAAPGTEAGRTVSETNAERNSSSQTAQTRERRALAKASADEIRAKRTRQAASAAKGKAKAAPPSTASDGAATTTGESTQSADAAAAAASAPAKKPRRAAKPRAKKATRQDVQTEPGEGEDQAPPEADATAAPKRKKRKKATAAVDSADAETEPTENTAGGQPKKRGRKRAETPEDAASRSLDTSTVTMGDIVRDPRIGKISEREEKIRKIDWAEVKRKRDAQIAQVLGQEAAPTDRATTAAPAENQAAEHQTPARDPDFQRDIDERRRAAEKRARDAHAAKNGAPPTSATPPDTAQDGSALIDAASPKPASRPAASSGGPRLKLVNGQLVVEQSSLVIDRHAEAAADEAALEEVEEDDLTVRVNTRTWLNANKRSPADRLPWRKADRWTAEETDAFYDALRMFGTDFFIISKMFARRTRRQVKMKFVREEKLDPERVKAALVGEEMGKIDFQAYLERTNTTEADYRDPGELREELRREEEVQKEEIERTRREYVETMRQKRLAEGEEAEGNEPSKGGKKGTKKNKKKSAVGSGGGGGGEEVEVLETIND